MCTETCPRNMLRRRHCTGVAESWVCTCILCRWSPQILPFSLDLAAGARWVHAKRSSTRVAEQTVTHCARSDTTCCLLSLLRYVCIILECCKCGGEYHYWRAALVILKISFRVHSTPGSRHLAKNKSTLKWILNSNLAPDRLLGNRR